MCPADGFGTSVEILGRATEKPAMALLFLCFERKELSGGWFGFLDDEQFNSLVKE